MAPAFRVLVINPGSTGTKLALFTDEGPEAEETVQEGASGGALLDQLPGRIEGVFRFLRKRGDSPLHAVVGRGGLIRPVPSGTLIVNEAMLEDARKGYQGEHVSNLGCLIAHAVAERYGVPAYVVDPVAVDEMLPLARYTGLPQIRRQALSHALNLHAAARKACERLGKKLKESRLVVAHLGGGFSIVPMEGGRILDTNNANSGGPFSPTRAGTLPTQPLIRLCFSGTVTAADLKRMTTREGGLVAHLGTHDALEVEARIAQGDQKAREVYEAMAYQTAKEIGAMAAVLSFRLDAVVLTGGLCHSNLFCKLLAERIGSLAPIFRFPGEFEMEALAMGAIRVLRGEEDPIDYPGETTCEN
ncbi:MAG: butyrate kinase [Acidobacteriota bacterium]